MTRHGQHTDGPWEVQPFQSDNSATLAIVSPTTGFTVALIPFDPDMQTVDSPTHETVRRHPCDTHNANLLATAPDLYDALLNLRASILLYADTTLQLKMRTEIKDASVALDEARGQQ